MKDWYKEDLVYIHDVGFSDYALKSAPGIIEILQENNITEGLIVDLGCGSGLSAQEFIKANYQTLTALFDRIYKALIPGGIFIFDILEPVATRITQGFQEGKDWIVLVEKEEDREQKKLTRRIITLRKEGNYYNYFYKNLSID